MKEKRKKTITETDIVTKRNAQRRSFLTKTGGLILSTATVVLGAGVSGRAQTIRLPDAKRDSFDTRTRDFKLENPDGDTNQMGDWGRGRDRD